jgi:hypothetical protein
MILDTSIRIVSLSSIQNRLIDATNRIISKSLGKKGNS